LSPTFDPAQVN